jgi:hypothetical protein
MSLITDIRPRKDKFKLTALLIVPIGFLITFVTYNYIPYWEFVCGGSVDYRWGCVSSLKFNPENFLVFGLITITLTYLTSCFIIEKLKK